MSDRDEFTQLCFFHNLFLLQLIITEKRISLSSSPERTNLIVSVSMSGVALPAVWPGSLKWIESSFNHIPYGGVYFVFSLIEEINGWSSKLQTQ